jgi:predicted nucleotide-binding protein
MRLLQQDIESELSKLQSIHARLQMWAPETTATMTSSSVSLDAPIFIVHGSDTLRAESVARTVSIATGQQTIILREQPNLGRTLMEKFEQHAAEASYAVIVLTADDKGCRADETDPRPRGRQNVILEMGYFYALLGRDRVSVLLHPGVEKPSDMDGIVYNSFDDNGAWKTELLREL